MRIGFIDLMLHCRKYETILALLFTSIQRRFRELVELYLYIPSVSSWHVWDNSTWSSISIGDISRCYGVATRYP
jgi:hypothetical protein